MIYAGYKKWLQTEIWVEAKAHAKARAGKEIGLNCYEKLGVRTAILNFLVWNSEMLISGGRFSCRAKAAKMADHTLEYVMLSNANLKFWYVADFQLSSTKY